MAATITLFFISCYFIFLTHFSILLFDLWPKVSSFWFGFVDSSSGLSLSLSPFASLFSPSNLSQSANCYCIGCVGHCNGYGDGVFWLFMWVFFLFFSFFFFLCGCGWFWWVMMGWFWWVAVVVLVGWFWR